MVARRGAIDSSSGELRTLELLKLLHKEGGQMITEGPFRPSGVERRRHPRFPCLLDARFRQIGEQGPVPTEEGYIRCKAVNISEGGLLLEGDAYVPEGQRLEIYVKLEDGFKTIAGEAETVRAEKKFGVFRIGVKFIKKQLI